MPKCTLEIRDEVNVKFHNLDASTRRKLTKAVEFFIPGARYSAAYKLGRWNGKTSFCDTAGRTYLHLLDKLIPIVVEAGYEIEISDHRQVHDIQFEHVTKDLFAHVVWPPKHPKEGEPIELRDYQIGLVNNLLDATQGIHQAATGAGKTLVTAALSARCEPYGRTIIIVPNKDLVVNTERMYAMLNMDVGVLYGDRKHYTSTHTIATWQSIESLLKDVKDGIREEEMMSLIDGQVCIIVDEVHKAKADVLKKQLTSVFANVPIRWGFTGTIPEEEHDALSCIASIGPIIGELSSKELQDKGVLSKLDIDVVQLQDGVLGFKSYQQELKWLVTDSKRLECISDLIHSYAKNGNTLVLIDRIATGEKLIEMNPSWEFINGTVKSTDRQDTYDSVSDNDGLVIVATYGVAAVGIDMPRIFNLVLIEAGKSFVRVIQSIGRGIRVAKDKDYVRVVDVTSNLKYSKRHLTKRKKFYQDQKFPFKVTKVKYD
jgi:superfamily II DNA or RNA helicase